MPPIHPPRQADHRLLVVYAIQGISRREYLDAQIQHYVALCESGFEVHLLLATGPGAQWEEYFRTSRLFCFRTQRAIPLSVINEDFASEAALPARHRRVFLHFNGSYDYYLNQEDDVIMKTHNFYYYLKWMDIFDSRREWNLLPGFIDNEVFWHRGSPSENISIPVIGFFTTYVLLFNHEPLLIFSKTLQRLYILNQNQLTRFSAMEEWLGDLRRPYFEPNVHMQARWLSRYFRFAVPLRDYYSALTHHSSDRYVYLKSETEGFQTPHHNYAVHPAEFVQLVLELTNQVYEVNHHQRWELKLSPSRHLYDCLETGRVLKIDGGQLSFMGPFPHKDPYNSTVHIKRLSCRCSIDSQDLERCADPAAEVCHPTVYRDKERIHVPIDLDCFYLGSRDLVNDYISHSSSNGLVTRRHLYEVVLVGIIAIIIAFRFKQRVSRLCT